MSIRLTTLGPPRCYVDDTLTDLSAQKLRFALLLFLAVQRRVARESVAAMFWPGKDEERARHTLSQNIYELRRLLGEDWLKATTDPLEVTDAVSVDVVEFERLVKAGELEQALSLYHGDFLAGFHVKGSNEFASWIDSKRRDLKRLHHRAYRELIASRASRGDLAGATSYAQKWAEIDALDDEANHTLIDMLGQCGRRAEAIKHFERYEKWIRAELDVAPLDETRELIARMRENTAGTSLPSTPLRAAPISRPRFREIAAAPPAETWWTRITYSRVAKVAAVYTATTFVVIQFADVMVPSLNLPATIINIAAVLAVLGFPVTVGIAWALETGGIIGNHESLKSTEPSSSLGNFWLRSAAVVALLTVIAVGVATIKPDSMRILRQPSLDPASYVVFPLANPAGEERDALEAALYSALTKWTDINVTSPREVRLEKPSALTATVGERADIARAFAARYFISMTVSPAGKQLRVGADLHDVESAARPIRHAEVVISQTELQADTIFARLAATLLFDNSAAALPAGGTASFVARTAFERGLASVREWNLGAADSLFLGAVQSDAEFARAYLWLAQVRYWQKADPAAWSYLISHAVEDSARLSPLDRLSINALNSVVQKDPVACEQLKTVTQQYAHDFAGWFSYATCLFLDDAVVPDAKSPSGFSFRVSHRQAINAYQKALQLMPSIHRGLQGNSFIAVRQALYTSRNRVRSGRAAAPDTGTFSAHPSWQADTLAFVPVRDVDLTKPLSWLKGSEVDEALRRQRRLFYDVAKTWATANQRSPEALEALALGLELLGHPTAADTLRRARELAQTNEQRTQLGTREVLLRLRTSIPDDVRGMTRARVLADSLLAGYDGNAKGRALIASIAALTGRARDAARLYAASESTINVDPAEASMVATAARLLAYSALGGPPDSLAALETIVTRAIDNSLSQRAASNARRQWIVRAALLALPVHRFDSFTKLEDPLPVYAAQRAWLAGNDSVALRILAEREIVRSRVKPWDQTFDILYAEGWLWAKLGHPRKALQWIEPTLTSLEWSSPESLASPVRSGAFLRSLVLRADLAMQTGDKRGAALWSRSVLVLWQNADEFLRPEIERMKRYQSP